VLTVGGANPSYVTYPNTPTPAGVVHRGAMSWALAANTLGAHDGTAATIIGPAGSLPVITSLAVASNTQGQPPISQYARRLTYWPRQLSQSELLSVTS